MAEYKVTINATPSKAKAISVSPKNVQNTIIATPDTSLYFSNLSRQWAIGEGLIQGEGYSSKHYANLANESAAISQANAEASENIYNQFQDSLEGSLNNVDNAVQEAITTIDTKSGEAIETINTSVEGAIDEINNTKIDIITGIELVADGEKKEIEDLIDSGKDEIQESIKDIKVLTTLEIGDIGIAPLGIDETKGKRRYLNGQVIIQDQYTVFSDKVKDAIAANPSLGCTESEWQSAVTMSAFGQCGKFVVDDDAGTIRLPKITGFIQGLTDLASLGDLVEAGLPQHTHTRGTMEINGWFTNHPVGKGGISEAGGAFALEGQYVPSGQNGVYGTATGDVKNINFFASRSWTGSTSNANYTSTLATTNTVQPESVRYSYFIQVATGAETEADITNELELNIPFFFGMSQYFDIEPNNISWLKSAGQWNSKALYPSYYDWILSNVNGGVEGFVLSTSTYTDYDFVINTANETFRLPLLDGSESLVSDRYDDLTLKASGSTYTAPANGWFDLRKGASDGQSIQMTSALETKVYQSTGANEAISAFLPVTKGNNVQIHYSASGTIYAFRFVYAQGNGSLYYYVGETAENPNIVNLGRVEEKIASLIPDNSSLISGYGMPSTKRIGLSLGASGSTYTAPANGWFYVYKRATANGQYAQISANGKIADERHSSYSNAMLTPCVPVLKGDVVKCLYSAAGTTEGFGFIYAEGEE